MTIAVYWGDSSMRYILAITIMTVFTLPARAGAFDAQDDAQCRNYGATPGTQVYVDCRMKLTQMHMQMIQQMFNRPPLTVAPVPNLQSPPMVAPRNCITNYIGNTAYTNCN